MGCVYVQLKDGTRLEGPLFAFHPKFGWFSLVINHAPEPIRIMLRDVKSAVVSGHINLGQPVISTNYNLLDQARHMGWSE